MRREWIVLSSIVMILFVIAAFHAPSSAADGCGPKARRVSVGFVTDGATEADQALVELFKKEVASTLAPDFCPVFSERWTLSGNDTREGVRKALDRLLSSDGPGMVITLGIIASTEALERKQLSKPVIAPYVADFALKGRKRSKSSGIRNLVYIDSAYYLDSDIEAFRRLKKFKKIGLILDKRELYYIGDIYRLAHEFGERHGLKVSLVPAWDSADDVLAELPQGIDAVLVGPLWHLGQEQQQRLAEGLIARGIAGFAIWDRAQVEAGLLAGAETGEKHVVLARRTAVAILDILQGDRPRSINVEFARERMLTINMATARRLNIYPSLLLQTEADLINEEEETGARRLNIRKAVEEAIAANLRLQSAYVNVKAGEHAVREAMADLLPRIDVSTGARAIDDDRAEAGGGVSPERAWTGSAGGSILLYSDTKWARYTAEKHLQQARKMDKERVKLDVTYDAAVAYLNVLRARTVEKIYKENLSLTKANLERAKIKVSTGAAGPDEVYRWESKFANDRRQVLYRESDTMDAMEALNRILHRPLQESFIPEEASLDDPLFIVGDDFYYRLMETPMLLEKFKEFAAREAVALRPELRTFDAAIRAKERLKVAAKREIWLPDFTVEWNVDHYIAEDGRGERDDSPLDDTDWSVGVFARIPLFEGGKTVAKARRLQEEVSRLYINKNALEEKVIQDVLSAINRTRASYPSISLTREAEEAARKNLELVTNAYIQGIKSIIDLLDAQNQYLNAKLDSANAVYNFLIDLMGVQRAMGEFFLFMPDEMRDEWLQRARTEISLR